MKIEICKWYGGAASPVLFWVDDLANTWVDANRNGVLDIEEDWGSAKDGENSSFAFLKENIAGKYPALKITFFVPVGPRSGVIDSPYIKVFSDAINSDEGTREFFKSINGNPMYEIAYHGTTHGVVGERTESFVQEWDKYESIEEAMDTIGRGKEIYKEVFGSYPKGGKYCGYKSGAFGDESIDKSGFMWWCRYSNRALFSYGGCDYGGSDLNQITAFDVKTFGENGVIDIPTTLEGSMFNRFIKRDRRIIKGTVKRLFNRQFIEGLYRQIEFLIENRLVISVYEHISPARNDGKRQYPNIFDDAESLNMIFGYLQGRNVWYCTGSELAEYYYLRENCRIEREGNSFSINCDLSKWDIENKVISLKIEGLEKAKVIMPDKRTVCGKEGIFNLEMMDGAYEVIAGE